MALDDILARIRKDADDEVNLILKSARNKAAQIRHRHAAELREFEDRERTLHENRQAEMKNVYMAEAHRSARQLKLNTEEDLINQCFTELEARLKMLVGEVYNGALKALVTSGLKLQGGVVTIKVVRDADITVIENLIPGLVNTADQKVVVDRTTLHPDCLGGVQLISGDGKTIVDNTFKAILARNREAYRIDIARFLFGEG